MSTSNQLTIPSGLLQSGEDFATLSRATSILLRIPNDYEVLISQDSEFPEVIAIQRLITLARRGVEIEVQWEAKIANQFFSAPPLFPLLAVLLCLECSEHRVLNDQMEAIRVDVHQYRKTIHNFRPLTDLFADSQVVLCSDSRGQGRPKALYNLDGTLISRFDFEAFVERLLAAQVGVNVDTAKAVKFSQSVSTIVAELFENTDIHGKHDLNGIPFKSNGVRGMMFKRIVLPSRSSTRGAESVKASQSANQEKMQPVALEISVFDSGVGYYAAYSKHELNAETPLMDEWRVLHKCLERHYDTAPSAEIRLPDKRASHTGMGLYEVLRALQFLKGKFEVRSGRAYGFRTFLEGETQFQLEPPSSTTRPGMPKPVLLDQEKQFVSVPSANEMLVGSAIRVLIPLS